MAEKTFEASPALIERTLSAIIMQAEAHGVDVNTPEMIEFLKHLALVLANSYEEANFMNRILNKQLENDIERRKDTITQNKGRTNCGEKET